MPKKVVRARKPKYDEPLVNISIVIRKDQHEALQERENISEWVRDAIDMKIEAEGGETKAVDVVAISKRISFLQQRIEKVRNTPEYEKAQYVKKYVTPEYIEKARSFLKEGAVMKVHSESIEMGYFQWGCELKNVPGWTPESLRAFLHSKNCYSNAIPPELGLIIIDQMEKAVPFELKIVEGYEKRIAELQAEIDKLKEKIVQ